MNSKTRNIIASGLATLAVGLSSCDKNSLCSTHQINNPKNNQNYSKKSTAYSAQSDKELSQRNKLFNELKGHWKATHVTIRGKEMPIDYGYSSITFIDNKGIKYFHDYNAPNPKNKFIVLTIKNISKKNGKLKVSYNELDISNIIAKDGDKMVINPSYTSQIRKYSKTEMPEEIKKGLDKILDN